MVALHALALTFGLLLPQEACERQQESDLGLTWLPAPEPAPREDECTLRILAQIVCSRCRAALPAGTVITLTVTPLGYRVLLAGDMLSFGTSEGIDVLTATPRVGRPQPGRGAVIEYEGPVDAPGAYRIHAELNPDYQVDPRIVHALRQFFRARRDELPVPVVSFAEDQVVMAGNPVSDLPALRPLLRQYSGTVERCREVLDELEELGRAGRGNDLEAKLELLDRLSALRDEAARERSRCLLTGSYGLLVTLLDDVRIASDCIQKLLEYEAVARGAGGGETSGPDYDWKPSWNPGGTTYGHPNPPPEWLPTIDAASYGGVLNLGNLRAVLEIAPLFGLREILLWHLRLSRLAVDEAASALRSWVAATGAEARAEGARSVERRIERGSALAASVDGRAFTELGNRTAMAAPKYREDGWDRSVREMSGAYWPALTTYFVDVRRLLSDANRTEVPPGIEELEAQLRTEAERMHGEIAKAGWSP